MDSTKMFIARVAMIVALGGFLMGFDASVISGVIKFITLEFDLTELEVGWSVGSLTLTATLAMMFAGPLSDKYGRKQLLIYASILYAISAIGSAFAPTFWFLVVARMIGGLGVGASLILAPMYIAEISPAKIRGQMVSFNQLNIVIGISVAFFTNYFILDQGNRGTALAESLGLGEYNWRWMLGLETLPAILYFVGLYFVPRSPRWLVMKKKYDEAKQVFAKIVTPEEIDPLVESVEKSIEEDKNKESATIGDLWKPALRLVLIIGVVIAVLQQITGINSVFFYAPMIFEQSGIGTDASFVQAILVGLVNLVFTVLAIMFIDRLGRRPLLIGGMAGITVCMAVLAFGFGSATYTLDSQNLDSLPEGVEISQLTPIMDKTYESDVEFKAALASALGETDAKKHESALITSAISMDPMLILFGILGFVASFAISIGPVMWVLFSELFPIRVKGIAISFVGAINSGVSFLVQVVFPWELSAFGSSITFLIYGVLAALGLVFIIAKVPETKGKSLEELETLLVKS